MSINLLLPDEDEAVIWRGPLIGGAIKQFWGDVVWGDLDVLVVDLPPGTSDASLTVMQSIPLNGVVLVTSPQDLAGMVVRKAARMAWHMKVSIVGLVENMSYAVCPKCGERIEVFGPSQAVHTANLLGWKEWTSLVSGKERVLCRFTSTSVVHVSRRLRHSSGMVRLPFAPNAKGLLWTRCLLRHSCQAGGRPGRQDIPAVAGRNVVPRRPAPEKGAHAGADRVKEVSEMDRGRGRGSGAGSGGGRGPGRMGGPFAAGPGGNCVCPGCGHKEPHMAGQPCYQKKCPKCRTQMIRE